MGSNSRPLTIRQRKIFEFLNKKGQRVYPNSWMILNFHKNELDQLRCGWTIPKYVGTAVTRNRIRRWNREFFNNLKKQWDPGLDINIVLRKCEKDFFKKLEHNEYKAALAKGIEKLRRKI